MPFILKNNSKKYAFHYVINGKSYILKPGKTAEITDVSEDVLFPQVKPLEPNVQILSAPASEVSSKGDSNKPDEQGDSNKPDEQGSDNKSEGGNAELKELQESLISLEAKLKEKDLNETQVKSVKKQIEITKAKIAKLG